MKARLVPLLRCPSCRGEFDLNAHASERDASDEPHVVSGSLQCRRCARRFPIADGIPRLLTGAAASVEHERRRTASRFGYLWSQSTVRPAASPRAYHFEKIEAAVALPTPAGLVLDAGCGEGVDLANVAARPGVEIVGVELSDGGVTTSFARTRALPNAHVVQADLRALPFAGETFHLVYSYGVVHHLTPPESAMREIARVTRAGGGVAIYVYEDFGTRALPLRLGLCIVNSARGLTTRMPPRLLFALCRVGSPFVFAACTVPHLVFRNVPGVRAAARALPFRHGKHPFGLTGDLFDRFSAPVELRYSRDGAMRLLGDCGLRNVRAGYERGWVAAGTKPG